MKILILFTIFWQVWAAEMPQRKLAVIITPYGIVPDKISAFSGEELTIFVGNMTETAQVLNEKSMGIYLSIPTHQTLEKKIKVTSSGEFLFDMMDKKLNLQLTVLAKPSLRKEIDAEDESRSPASSMAENDYQKKYQNWKPKVGPHYLKVEEIYQDRR